MTTEGAADPEILPPGFTRAQLLYVWLAAFFSACLILADIIGIKLFELGPVVHTCGMLTFPLTFLITDLVNEYYGKQAARRMTYIAFAMGLFAFVVIFVALRMPYLQADFNVPRGAFEAVFEKAQRMYVASLVAYLFGQLFDVWMFGVMKRLTGGKRLWLRATGSTVVSQMLDSLIVTTLAFGDQMPVGALMKVAATGYVLKFCLAVGVTPFMYAGREVMHRGIGLRPLPPD